MRSIIIRFNSIITEYFSLLTKIANFEFHLLLCFMVYDVMLVLSLFHLFLFLMVIIHFSLWNLIHYVFPMKSYFPIFFYIFYIIWQNILTSHYFFPYYLSLYFIITNYFANFLFIRSFDKIEIWSC